MLTNHCIIQLIYPVDVLEKVDTLFKDAARALDLNNCALHCEMRVQDGQPYLIEMAGRPGGGHVFRSDC